MAAHREAILKPTLHGLVALGLVLQGAAVAVHATNATNVQILSATIRDQKIDGASITLQKNGEQSVVATTDPLGHAQLPDPLAADATALVIVRKAGYSRVAITAGRRSSRLLRAARAPQPSPVLRSAPVLRLRSPSLRALLFRFPRRRTS
jgi:hypothetical protein